MISAGQSQDSKIPDQSQTDQIIPPHLAAIPHSTHLYYLEHALSLAQLSPPKPTNFRVGAVLVSFSSDAQPHDLHPISSSSLSDQLSSPQNFTAISPTSHVDGTIIATGYTLELSGNTHAEQCCLLKLASLHNIPESRVGEVLKPQPHPHQPPNTQDPAPDTTIILYTTMEPCAYRLSGNTPCVERILAIKNRQGRQAIDMVVVGVGEPDTFVKKNEGRRRLEDSGIRVLKVEGEGLEERILEIARAGHVGGGG